MFWDFISLRPETTHQVSFLFSDRGTPDGFRRMNGYGSHTFTLCNKNGERIYCKFHLKTDQGIKNLSAEDAGKLAGSDPDYAIRDLYNSIASKDFPSWSFYIQVMTKVQAEKFKFNPFDLTKVWSQKEYPLIPVGKVVLNKNADNYFAEIEQSAFSPSNMVPGIEASPDKMLQGRLFSYHDTHLHRLGANYLHLPVNCPKNKTENYQRDGPMCIFAGSGPNYFPNSFSGPKATEEKDSDGNKFLVQAGECKRHESGNEDNFTQVGIFWREVLNEAEKDRLASNIAGHLKDAQAFIQKRAVNNFAQADAEYGRRIQSYLDKYSTGSKA